MRQQIRGDRDVVVDDLPLRETGAWIENLVGIRQAHPCGADPQIDCCTRWLPAYGGGSFHCGVSTERDPAETASGATSPKLGPPRGTDDQAIRCTARRWRQRGCQRLCAPATRAAFRACSRALRVGSLARASLEPVPMKKRRKSAKVSTPGKAERSPGQSTPEEALQGPPARETVVVKTDRERHAEKDFRIHTSSSPRLAGGDGGADWVG